MRYLKFSFKFNQINLRVAEEKRQLEKSLEEERKQKDTEIKEVIKQHQVLLNEKESKISIE